jgi:O-antigen ligase
VDRYSSFNVRRQSFPIAYSIFRDKPFFGGGPFNSFRHKEDYTVDPIFKATSFENSYLDFLVDLGFVGMGILILLVLSVLKPVFFDLFKDGPLRIYKVASLTSLVIMLINMATFNFDSYRLFHFIVWFVIGINLFFSKSNAGTTHG